MQKVVHGSPVYEELLFADTDEIREYFEAGKRSHFLV